MMFLYSISKMKNKNYLISSFLIFTILLNMISFCYSNPNFINSPTLHRTLFEELRKQKKQLEGTPFHDLVHKQIKQYEYLYFKNPAVLYKELEQIHEDFKSFSESDDYKNHVHEITKSLNEFNEIYDDYRNNNNNNKTKYNSDLNHIHNYIDNLDEFSKESIKHIIDHRYLYNRQNHNLTHLIESLPHMLTDFEGHHKAPKIHQSFRINNKFQTFLNEIEHYYKPSSTKNMTYLEKKKFLTSLEEKLHPEHKTVFTSFLQEYFQEAVLDNDYLKDRYTRNNMDKIIEEYNKDPEKYNNFHDQTNKAKQRKIKQHKRSKQIKINRDKRDNHYKNYRFNEEAINKTANKTANKTVNKTKKVNKTEEALKKITKPKTEEEQADQDEKDIQSTSKELLKQQASVKAKMAGMLGKLEEENNKPKKEPIIIQGTCDEREALTKKKIKEELKKVKAEEEEKKKDKKKNDKEKKEGADKAKQFLSLVMSLVAKVIPFNIIKVCLPPVGLTLECCPEAMAFPEQLYQIMQIPNKIPEFLLAVKGYPGWLFINGHSDIDEVPYYICAQIYLTLFESKIFPKCDPKSLVLMNPLNIAGIIPGDLPVCFASCIMGAATCQVMFDKFSPCALFSIYTAISAIADPTLQLTLINAFSNCTFLPFLVRWDIVPKWVKPRPKPKSEGGTGPPGEKAQEEADAKDESNGVKCPPEDNEDDEDDGGRQPTPVTQTALSGGSGNSDLDGSGNGGNEKTLQILIHRWEPQLTKIQSSDGEVNVIENFDTFIDDKFATHALSMELE